MAMIIWMTSAILRESDESVKTKNSAPVSSERRCAEFDGSVSLDFADVRSLQTLRAFLNIELYGVTFIQVSVPFADNRFEVHKYILTAVARNEAITFGSIEPLDCSLLHGTFLSL
jgi:hypothetical protein